ncbi:MAG: EamA family transporter [Flavobacteriales bacterium]|nr:EamA family transporter [Flavobacteriales bacterium]|tara:strand:+ start:730 stop:1620 length:891 start_codon:yes stop_codon:yes gene_type:complete
MYQILRKNKLVSLHIMVIFLGFTGVLGKLISLETPYLVWHRMFIAFISLFFFLLFKKQIRSINKKDILPLLGIGAIVALHWFFFFGAIKVANISVAVICLATASLFSAFMEPIFFKRKLLKYELVFGIIVFGALSFMLYEKPENEDINYFLGYVYGIASAFLGTLFTMFNGKYINKVDAAKITMVEMLGGVILISLYFIYIEDYSILTTSLIFDDIIYLILLGTICTAGIFVWMTEIMRHITPYALIMAINLEPIYSIIIGLIIFSETETMNLSFYIGSSIILFIVFLDGYIKNKK